MRILIIIFLTFSTPGVGEVWASQRSQVKEGTEAFKNQQWDQAIDHYMNAMEGNKNTDIVQYDLGTAFYKKGNYDQSMEHLQKSISTKNTKLSSKTYYNLGNALYKKGRSLENNNIDGAIDSLQKSLANYATGLNLTPKDQDGTYNRDVVQKELERLKKKKQQQSPQQQSQGRQSQAQQPQNASAGQNQKSDRQPSGQGAVQQRQNLEKQQTPTLRSGQAQQVLNDYESEEAPKGLLNFADRHQKEESHVDRDW